MVLLHCARGDVVMTDYQQTQRLSRLVNLVFLPHHVYHAHRLFELPGMKIPPGRPEITLAQPGTHAYTCRTCKVDLSVMLSRTA